MNKDEFLADKNVSDFSKFLAETLPSLRIHLKIKKSAKVPGGIDKSITGLPELLNNYRWNSGYTAKSGEKIVADDWLSTKSLLTGLSSGLKLACASGDEVEAQRVAAQILQWGGDRNKKVGATIDIKYLVSNNRLISYLQQTKAIFAGQSLEAKTLRQVRYTGSMWTKIYALNSDDGLPIYDSRVAMGMVGLVKLFCDQRNTDFGASENNLKFRVPAGTNWDRNKKIDISSRGVSKINKDDPVWSEDTLKLSWLMDDVLKCSDLFSEQGDIKNRKHGFEASLFLLGYDLKAIFH